MSLLAYEFALTVEGFLCYLVGAFVLGSIFGHAVYPPRVRTSEPDPIRRLPPSVFGYVPDRGATAEEARGRPPQGGTGGSFRSRVENESPEA